MRQLGHWIHEYVKYASFSEAPRQMHFWSGVSAVAGALRRKVWIDQVYFKWYPSFYIIFVAPPGIVSKSTTADISMSLLRKIPGINFGPDVVTWQALVTAFAASAEQFEYRGEWHTMSALTLLSSELGNLINPHDKEMINLLITLWDGRDRLDKVTKMSGNDSIDSPWINLLGCTTPHWMADNMPAAIVGGGFTSRCIFVYAEQKEKYIAYPGFNVPRDIEARRQALLHDLEHIALNLCGEYTLAADAVAWGEAWYQALWSNPPAKLDDAQYAGYLARKQTHVHKLAMVLAASQRDEMVITQEDLQMADIMMTETEADMEKVFSRIGKSETSLQVDRLIDFIRRRRDVRYEEALRLVQAQFPDLRDFEGVLAGIIKAGYVTIIQRGQDMYLVWKGDK